MSVGRAYHHKPKSVQYGLEMFLKMLSCLQLNDTFLQFAGYGTRQPETCIDGKNFTKLCKDCGLMDKKFTTTNADLVFSKVFRLISGKQPSQQKVHSALSCTETRSLGNAVQEQGRTQAELPGVQEGCGADSRQEGDPSHPSSRADQSKVRGGFINVLLQGVSIAEVEEAVINSGGPKSLATKADYVKFHDDKSTYTGVYAK